MTIKYSKNNVRLRRALFYQYFPGTRPRQGPPRTIYAALFKDFVFLLNASYVGCHSYNRRIGAEAKPNEAQWGSGGRIPGPGPT